MFSTTGPFPRPDRIRYDPHCVQIDGRDVFLYGGAFHYFRVPRELWRDRFQKMKEAGFNMVETYVPWNYSEREAPSGPSDFSKIDLSELEAWMDMAEQFGFYIIIRPGPYICAEWAGGGYPQWLIPLFKPKDWPANKVWLQTDDPGYLAWNKHWYDAVTRVVAPHQITRKAPGSPGVILFQIENEYNRVSWIPSPEKTRVLASMARQARQGGIDVPIVTCWTDQSRDSSNPDLAGVFDFINSYPKWNVGKQISKQVAGQRRAQPDAPTAAMELQGGWYSAIGGQLSEHIGGVQPVQTQNLALYCLQSGYSILNYYMLVGGTNFDDWASREATTTYDFFAPIREGGGVGDKWRRVAGIGALLREQGGRLVRSVPVAIKAEVSDSKVEVALRRAQDGTSFFFVRTEDRSSAHTGTVRVKVDGAEYAFDFALEPFGSKVLVLPPGVTDAAKGEWLPKLPPEPARPSAADLPAQVVLTHALRRADPLPTTWTPLPTGVPLERLGVTGSHPIYYRVHAPGGDLVVNRLGAKVISGTLGDNVFAQAGDSLIYPRSEDQDSETFTLPAGTKQTVLLYERIGLHHHTTLKLEHEWALGLQGVFSGGHEMPLEYATTERERGLMVSLPQTPIGSGWDVVEVNTDAKPAPAALLTWYRFEFELPATKPGVWVPWHLKLNAKGNGFIYLNGRCIGRTWEVGPQRDFYLPECWLNFGPGKKNAVAVSLIPEPKDAVIFEAVVAPSTDFAEVLR